MNRLLFYPTSKNPLKSALTIIMIFGLTSCLSVWSSETQSTSTPTELSLIGDRAKLLKCRKLLQRQVQLLNLEKANKVPAEVLECAPIPQISKNLISVEGLYGLLKVNPSSLSGAGYQLGLNTAINEFWGVGLMVGQGFTSTNTTFFTQTSLEIKRAITGRLIHESTSMDYSGLMLHAFLHRMFVSTSSFDIGHFGLGSALSYQLPLNTADSFRLGLRADYSLRAQASFFSFQLFTGLNHRF